MLLISYTINLLILIVSDKFSYLTDQYLWENQLLSTLPALYVGILLNFNHFIVEVKNLLAVQGKISVLPLLDCSLNRSYKLAELSAFQWPGQRREKG